MTEALLRLPQESILRNWLTAFAITEVPQGFQLVTGLSVIGSLLRRNVWVDQVFWKVYPNISVLLVGPSGIGKDVSITMARKAIAAVDPSLEAGGKTMEAIIDQLVDRNPACAVIAAPELTAFLGEKDYQRSMVQELTDLLSTGEKVDVSLRSTGRREILQPTITMLAGSTIDWLHRSMPRGSLEGGFFPRFLIVCETMPGTAVPLLKYSLDTDVWKQAKKAFTDFTADLPPKISGEIFLDAAAQQHYTNWYVHRFEYFPEAAKAYANRSRDQVLRVAMLCAISCKRNIITKEDIEFGVAVVHAAAKSVEEVAIPPSTDAQAGEAILKMLPATISAVYRKLGRRFERRQLSSGIQLLIESGQATIKGGKLHKS